MSPRGGQAASVRASSYVVRGAGLGWAAIAVIALHAPVAAAAPAGIAVAVTVAVAVAVAGDFAFRLLTHTAVERAEHRSGPRGEEAHVSERSELCAVPSAREARREPMRLHRIGSRPARVSFGYLFFARAKKSSSHPEGERKPLLLLTPLPLPSRKQQPRQPLESRAFTPASQERATFLCSCKETWPKESTPCLRARRAARAGSTPPAGFFYATSLSRRKTTHIHVRRPSGFSRRLRRCGRGFESPKQAATARSQATATATATATAKALVLSHSHASVAFGMRPPA